MRTLLAVLGVALAAALASTPSASADEQPSGAEFAAIARSVRPGEWRLIPRPVSAVFYKRDEISATTWGRIGPRAIVGAWNGGAYDPVRHELHLHGGGHADYGGNEVLTFSFRTLTWRRSIETFDLPLATAERKCPQPLRDEDGPPSGHTWGSIIWSRALDGVLYVQTHGYCKRGNHLNAPGFRMSVWLADVKNGMWRRLGPAETGSYSGAVELPDGRLVVLGGTNGVPKLYDPHTAQYVRTGPKSNWRFPHAVYARDRNAIFVLERGSILRLDPRSLLASEVIDYERLRVGIDYNDGFLYHAPTRKLVLWGGRARIVVVDPDSGAVRTVEAAGAAPNGSRPWSKFVHLEEFDVLAGVSSHDDGVWLYRLPEVR
jgi:hypothetical protein